MARFLVSQGGPGSGVEGGLEAPSPRHLSLSYSQPCIPAPSCPFSSPPARSNLVCMFL